MRETKVTFDNGKLNYSAELMRALAHPLRLSILEFIDTNDRIQVNDIYKALDIEQSCTSAHLGILKMSGVLEAEKEGQFVHYRINYDVVTRAAKAVNNFLGK